MTINIISRLIGTLKTNVPPFHGWGHTTLSNRPSKIVKCNAWLFIYYGKEWRHIRKESSMSRAYLCLYYLEQNPRGEIRHRKKRQFTRIFFIKQSRRSLHRLSSSKSHLKLLELLLGSSSLCHFEDVEPDSLAERSALSNGHNVSNCDVSAENTVITDVNRCFRYLYFRSSF